MELIEAHRTLLADHGRNLAFSRALARLILPGETRLLDIGSGTGFLSFLASRMGAKEVVGIEHSDVIHLSRELAKENRIENCTFIQGHSFDINLPARFDLVVTETLGSLVLEENILEVLKDAYRFLAPGGRVVPVDIEQSVAPVIGPRCFMEITEWDSVGFGLTFDRALEQSVHNLYVKSLAPNELLLEESRIWDVIDLSPTSPSLREAELIWRFPRPETIYGFGLWWSARLADEIQLSTAPTAPLTHWKQVYLPVREPVVLGASEPLHLRLLSDSRSGVGVHIEWEIESARGVQALKMFD